MGMVVLMGKHPCMHAPALFSMILMPSTGLALGAFANELPSMLRGNGSGSTLHLVWVKINQSIVLVWCHPEWLHLRRSRKIQTQQEGLKRGASQGSWGPQRSPQKVLEHSETTTEDFFRSWDLLENIFLEGIMGGISYVSVLMFLNYLAIVLEKAVLELVSALLPLWDN